MSAPRPGKPLVSLFWRLYIILGLASTAAGVYLIGLPHMASGAGGDQTPIRVVGAILLTFGLVRIGNALFQLRRSRRS